ncbi:ABC transporter ATP-binding protein [Caldicoprobacter faecalis]|uniref:Oligopeptide transport system ATP-binding protein n=1 Tax=Caldicoprobacter faecalis TaxID=937334 RepID=A0A1I5SPT6_9FIRM|nr:dipeptide ABC transporter ATP-binding protein [Caldicoprobacter faecalis]SFP72804.1 oligopeptide transport system ATP-binding protein [Caldicoprobacter faecalis]
MSRSNEVLVEVRDLKKYFPVRGGLIRDKNQVLKAVDGVTFSIYKGETLGLVGESGCGKTTIGRTILKLYSPTSGQIIFDGNDITNLNDRQMRPYRKRMQIIFQDPYASLNPRMTVGDIIAESIDIHKIAKGEERKALIYDLLNKVGLSSEHANRYPHEFSGGQRQRIGIARALAVNPDFIVCDEPISALDVSIQAQVVNLLEDLQDELGLTYLFIAHDLSMVKHISDRVGVMYLGKLVEIAPSAELYDKPLHPYTRALLSAIPIPDPDAAKQRNRIILKGDVPTPINPPSGCRFRTRCPIARERCAEEEPVMKDYGGGHMAACHFIE